MRGVVFGAGGAAGLQMLGALDALQRRGAEEFEVFGGTSAGAIVAFVAALKTVRAAEVLAYALANPPLRLRSLNINNLLTRFGLDDGEKLFAYVARMFETLARGSSTMTFGQLHSLTGSTLRVTATCTTTSALEIFDHVRSPECVIMQAIRASCSVPLYFTPHRIGERSYVDGALLAYYPHALIDDLPEARRLGVFVGIGGRVPEGPASGVEDLAAYAYSLSCTACTAKELEAIAGVDWILMLPPDDRCAGKLSLGLDPAALRGAFEAARDAASSYLDDRMGAKKAKCD